MAQPWTGEGLSLAFTCAEAKGAVRESLQPYERVFQRAFRKYAWLTGAMLMLARRPRLRRPLVRWLGGNPRVFERILAHAMVSLSAGRWPSRPARAAPRAA